MSLRIVTINLPHPYIEAMQTLVDLGLYNSRSQIVRVCLTEFLEKEKRFITDLNEGNISQIQEMINSI